MSVADKLTKLSTDITSAYNSIQSKGGTIPAHKNTDNLSTAISSIPSGGWQPQPDWWDIDSILANDTENYSGKVIILIPDYAPTSIIQTGPFTIKPSMAKTSDGTTYNNVSSNITHTWDTTKDRTCSLGYKTRYVILYYNSSEMNFGHNQASYDLWKSALYIIINGITISSMANGNIFTNSNLLECLKITNGLLKPSNLTLGGTLKLKKIIGLDTSLVTNMNNFCSSNGLVSYNDFWKDYQIDTSKVTSFSGAFNTSGLRYIPSLDFNSATNINNMFNTSTIITINEIKNIKISGINLKTSTLLNHDTLIRFLNALYDYSSSSNTYTLTLGNTNLAKLTSAEIQIGTDKGWTIN